MRKYGKYEKRPEKKPAAKQQKAKSLLLQTYFTSLLCLVLCVTMFFGTSYAWFTSEVNNSGNEIYVGNLKVSLSKGIAPNGQDLANSDVKLFDSNIRWEPGYTALETIQIDNKGDLSFDYVLTFTDGTLTNGTLTGGTLEDVAKYFDVFVFDHSKKQYDAPGSYSAIISNSSNWESVGTLAQVLDGEPVLSGKMTAVQQQDAANSDKYTIALHMKEEVNTSEVMGKEISLNVKLLAYQSASEDDDLGGEKKYDAKIVPVANAEGLADALASGKNPILLSDVELKTAEERVTMMLGVLDGNGNTITYSGEKVNGNSAGVVTTSGGKICNLTIEGGDDGRALYVTKLESDLEVSNCTFSGVYAFNLTSATKTEDKTISFVDTTFNSWVSYANVADHVSFTGCEFTLTNTNVLRPYGDTTLTNCTISGERLDVSKLEAGETITLVDCTYNGVQIKKATLTATSTGVTVSNNAAIEVNREKMVVLSSSNG